MSHSIYKITRQISVVFSFIVFVVMLLDGMPIKALANLILLVLFIYTSIEYQKKVTYISIPYLFVFFNLNIVYSLCTCYYNLERIVRLDSTGFQGWYNDKQYYIYFWGICITYIIINIYIKNFCKRSEVRLSDMRLSGEEIECSYLVFFFLIFFYLFLYGNDLLVVAVLASLLIYIVIDKKRRTFHLLFLLLLLIVFYAIFLSRYYVIQMFFPSVIAWMLFEKKNDKKISMGKLYIFLGIGMIGVFGYGIISEIIKLNYISEESYNLIDVVRSIDGVMFFLMRQIYRLFVVWIKNGGYILYHVEENGFYYGLTYVKPLAGFLGYKYVSLPEIAAAYNYSTYSQPGLFAEGYANFGMIGAVVNLVCVFALMEYTRVKYSKKPNIVTFSAMTIPFTKVLFDGGTLSSSLVLLVLVYLINVYSFLKKFRS